MKYTFRINSHQLIFVELDQLNLFLLSLTYFINSLFQPNLFYANFIMANDTCIQS